MKKVVLFFAVSAAFAFASCNDANTNAPAAADSTVVAEAIDSAAAVVDSAAAAVVDSAAAAVDSAIDSVKALGEAQVSE